MTKQIIWSPLAESDFASILEYLNKNWDQKVAANFIDLTEYIIDHISINPRQYPIIFKKKRMRYIKNEKHAKYFI